MSYFVVVSFDIDNGSSDNYKTVYSEFAKHGLSTVVKGQDGSMMTLPSTTCVGEYTGASSANVRDNIATKIDLVFSTNALHGKYFVSVGGDWSWLIRTP